MNKMKKLLMMFVLILLPFSVFSQVNYTIGNGTSTNSSTGNPTPYNDYYEGDRQQFLYRASDLIAAGMSPGMITAIRWDVTNTNNSNPQGWSMYIGATTATQLSTTFLPMPSTQVYGPGGTNSQPNSGANVYTLSTPFIWNGTDNIVIQTCHGVGSGCRGYTRNASVRYTYMPYYASTYRYLDCQGSLCNYSTGTRSRYRPNVTFTWQSIPYNNAAVVDMTNPGNGFCSGTYPIKVRIGNYGNNNINKVDVYWFVNGVAQTTLNYNSTITPFTTKEVTLGNVTFNGTPKNITVYTSMPNGVVDTSNFDDTLHIVKSSGLDGTYVVGSGGDFSTVREAADALNSFGVCGPVTMKIKPGTYTDNVTLNTIIGSSQTNRITFESQNNNNNSVILSYAASGTSHTLGFNNSSYVTFKDVTIRSSVNNSGRVVSFYGSSSYDSVVNCKIISTPASSLGSTNPYAIYADVLTGRENVFLNNDISGGYYGIFWEGTNTSNLTQDHVFEGNNIHDVYYMDARFYYNSGLKFRNNKIDAINSPTTHYALYSYYCDNDLEYINNDIKISGSGTKYGMYIRYNDGSSSRPITILNNSISIDNGTSTAYGIYCYYSKYQNFINNSVNVKSSSTSTNAARFYYSSSTYGNNNIINNVFSNETGDGYTLYLYTGRTSYNNTWDYNNIYNGKSTKLVQQISPSGNYNNLAAWVANQGQDKHSISYDPGFTSTLDLKPNTTNPASWSLNGRALQIPNNVLDINGNARIDDKVDGVPDIGAYEFTPEVKPPLCEVTPKNADNGITQTFTFGQREVAKIKWGNANVSNVDVRQYSGEKPKNLPNVDHMYFYTEVDPDNSVFESELTVNYMDIWTGVINEPDVKLAHKVTNYDWSVYNDNLSSVNTSTNTISSSSNIYKFGQFTGLRNGDVQSAFVIPNGKTIICIGANLVLDAVPTNGTYYKWYNNGQPIINAEGPNYKSLTVNQPGDYSVAITYGTKTVESFPINIVTIAPPNALITSNGTLTYCVGNGLTLNAGNSPNVTYQWQLNGNNLPGATNNTLSVNQAGNYTVVVTNLGCSSTSTLSTVTNGPLTVDLGNDTSYCEMKNIYLKLDAGYPGAKYQWSTGDTGRYLEVRNSGNYSVQVDGGPNCVDIDDININIDPLPSANGISYVKNGNTYHFSPSGPVNTAGYLWIFGDGTTTTITNPTKVITGDLYVRMVMFNACGTDTVQLGYPLTVDNLNSDNSINIYPNPTDDVVNIETELTIRQVKIISSTGVVVKDIKDNFNTIDVRSLPSGNYFIKVDFENSGYHYEKISIVR